MKQFLIFVLLLLPLITYAQGKDEAKDKNGSTFGEFEAAGQLFGGQNSIDDLAGQNNALVSFIGSLVTIVTALIVVVSIIAIVVAGYIYMTAGGDASKVGLSKTIIASALLGIVLALTAVIVLRTINPAFVPAVDPF